MIKKSILVSFMIAVIAVSSSAQMSLPEAVKAQLALTKKRPNNARHFNDLGNLLLLVDRESDAEDAYRRALELNPELVASRFNLALLLQQTRRPSKARREFRQVLKLEPDHAWSHYQLGVIYALEGRRAVAIKRYAEALRLEPRLTDPAFNPHILDNALAASATLSAYADLSSADLVPRIYRFPRRIAGMLVPLPADDSSQVTKPRKQRRKKARKKNRVAAPEEDADQGSASTQAQEAKPVPKPPVPQIPPRKPKNS